ncbi:N-acetylmuramoyl-L-alanine amidase [Alphaproteobacteria bacterium]|nr:N-acetylmuramoyl-L-alanine amidase [Alphaproteobacteria bacterium]MDC3273123.1 N-acetylmuramoyl-L-alanine amidase [Alphaproteobacteria bacterium]
MNNLIEIKPKTMQIILILLTFIFSHGVKSDQLKTNCGIKFNTLVCMNLDLNNNMKLNLLDEPYRIIIDFEKPIRFKNISKSEGIKKTLLTDVRLSSKSKLGSRLVLELSEPAVISEFSFNKVKENSELLNLEMSISNTSKTSFSIAKHVLYKNKGNFLTLADKINLTESKKQISLNKRNFHSLPLERPKNYKVSKIEKKIIVFIDPGHGGKDPGAIGALGTLEKNLTLKASFLIAKALNKNKRINALLSRTGDYFIPLRKRIKLAKKNKADVFISIHADSSENKKASGISVFSLSDVASDKEAQRLAKKENEVDKILGFEESIKDPLIYGSLIKMFQRESMNDSSILAKNIISNLKETKLAVNRGHRFAGFAVLKSYDIPSVLIEIGFLSNKQEEKKMLNNRYMKNLSQGLANAIESYLTDKSR